MLSLPVQVVQTGVPGTCRYRQKCGGYPPYTPPGFCIRYEASRVVGRSGLLIIRPPYAFHQLRTILNNGSHTHRCGSRSSSGSARLCCRCYFHRSLWMTWSASSAPPTATPCASSCFQPGLLAPARDEMMWDASSSRASASHTCAQNCVAEQGRASSTLLGRCALRSWACAPKPLPAACSKSACSRSRRAAVEGPRSCAGSGTRAAQSACKAISRT